MRAVAVLACLALGCTKQVVAPTEIQIATLEWDSGPLAVYQHEGYKARDYMLPVKYVSRLCGVRSFIGFDRGSLAEANLEVNFHGMRVYERSEHKETEENYDAWKERELNLMMLPGDQLHVHVGAAQTGPNTHDSGLSTRVHFALRFAVCGHV